MCGFAAGVGCGGGTGAGGNGGTGTGGGEEPAGAGPVGAGAGAGAAGASAPSCAGSSLSGVVPQGRLTLPRCTVTGNEAVLSTYRHLTQNRYFLPRIITSASDAGGAESRVARHTAALR